MSNEEEYNELWYLEGIWRDNHTIVILLTVIAQHLGLDVDMLLGGNNPIMTLEEEIELELEDEEE